MDAIFSGQRKVVNESRPKGPGDWLMKVDCSSGEIRYNKKTSFYLKISNAFRGH